MRLRSRNGSGASHNRRELVNAMYEHERQRIFAEAFTNIERSDAEREELLADIAMREANLPYEKPRQRGNSKSAAGGEIEEPEQPAERQKMDDATLALWNAWFDDRFNRAVQKQFESFAEIMGEEVAELEKRLLTRFNTELKRLEEKIATHEKIAELQTELEILRGNFAKNITPMRGARDVA